MPLITEKELKEFKKSNTVIIYGCGNSINDLNHWDEKELMA